jgi:flavin reductase (DIM6/NTAB) family NADH-FMN oxidoreductase RutF
MPSTPDTELSPLARALGRIPCGLYVVATTEGGHPVGFVASLVMQTGFDPPSLCVAVGKRRGPLAALRTAGRFALNVLDADGRRVMGAFFRHHPEGRGPFDGLDLVPDAAGGLPVLSAACAWLACRVTGEHDTGDHVVLFGAVEDGAPLREADPAVHLRRNGLDY